MKVCFFARVPDKGKLHDVEFYRQDINILRDLGFEVHLATRWSEIRLDVDFHYIWWWQWAFLPMLKSAIRRRPVIVTGALDHRSYLGRPFWERELIRYGLNHAARNLFISQFEFDQVTRFLAVPRSQCVRLAVDTETYRCDNRQREDFAFTVAWLNGPNAIRKCVPEIIRAIPLIRAKHPAMRFVIAGEKGTAYPILSEMAKDLGLGDSLEFAGLISLEQKIDLMQRCKVYVSPSRHEGFGLAILEAMSCGAPVVSSPVGAVSEVVGDAGLLVEGTSPEAVASAVNRYLTDDKLRESMSAGGRARAEKLFSYSRRKSEIETIIHDVLAKS